MSAIAVVATLNGIIVQVIMSSRVLYGLAAQGSLPAWLKEVNPLTRTPLNATLLTIAAVLVLALLLPLDELADITARITLAAVRAHQSGAGPHQDARDAGAREHLPGTTLDAVGGVCDLHRPLGCRPGPRGGRPSVMIAQQLWLQLSRSGQVKLASDRTRQSLPGKTPAGPLVANSASG